LQPEHDLPPLPEGFKRCSGKRAPSDGEWFIQLRGIDGQGFIDTRIAYAPNQLRWVWGPNSGDIVAVKRAE
jgi:hypothetical protein